MSLTKIEILPTKMIRKEEKSRRISWTYHTQTNGKQTRIRSKQTSQYPAECRNKITTAIQQRTINRFAGDERLIPRQSVRLFLRGATVKQWRSCATQLCYERVSKHGLVRCGSVRLLSMISLMKFVHDKNTSETTYNRVI